MPITSESLKAALITALLLAAAPALAQVNEPTDIGHIIAKGKCRARTPITIGATRAWLLASCWGAPSRRNISNTAQGTSEQWVYEVGGGSRYVYLVGGVVARVDDYGVRM